MSETAAPPKVYSLRQVATSIRSALERATGNRLWMVRAEVVKVKGNLGKGHVYLDLIDEQEGVKQAAMRGVIWRQNGDQIRKDLGVELPNVLKDGAEIVFHARVSFHEVFGLSLHIEKIDLGFMLGELERRKQATVHALTTSGEIGFNRKLPIPRVPQRVALIGSPGTSGFRDFCSVAIDNAYGFRMNLNVFEARVQGDVAPPDLIAALGSAEAWNPDVIVLVRGGGSKIDLDCFNDLGVCRRIAACTVPVWTGIGHESDVVVADLVAHTAYKTPTDCANRWVEHLLTAWSQLLELGEMIGRNGQQQLVQNQHQLHDYRTQIGSSARLQINSKRHELRSHRERIGDSALARISSQRANVMHSTEQIASLSQRRIQLTINELAHARTAIQSEAPRLLDRRKDQMAQLGLTLHAYALEHTLKRGFAIVRKEGESIHNTSKLKAGDQLTLQLHDGTVDVEVIGNSTPQERK